MISDTRSHWCLFECLSNDIRISNLAFEVQYVRSVITIKRGCVYLDRVRLASNGSQLPTAIQVYEDASLLAMNCDFSGFDIAIECFGRTSVKLDKCTFRDNNVCLKVLSSAFSYPNYFLQSLFYICIRTLCHRFRPNLGSKYSTAI